MRCTLLTLWMPTRTAFWDGAGAPQNWCLCAVDGNLPTGYVVLVRVFVMLAPSPCKLALNCLNVYIRALTVHNKYFSFTEPQMTKRLAFRNHLFGDWSPFLATCSDPRPTLPDRSSTWERHPLWQYSTHWV